MILSILTQYGLVCLSNTQVFIIIVIFYTSSYYNSHNNFVIVFVFTD